MIDLRSDTVTVPDEGMRRAMYEAEVGDDVFGEDPTVNRLERHVASMLGKDAGLFVPSGHMGNQVAIASQTTRGEEAIVADNSHIFNYESGTASVFSGIQLAPLPTSGGLLTADSVRLAKRTGYDWEAKTKLVCLENTVNRAGGIVYTAEQMATIVSVAKEIELLTHLDGARIWNACIALGQNPEALASGFDTVTVCLSKGLGAPVGSVLAGSEKTIRRARRFRKMMGGGMRQAGVLAGAGLYALENNFDKLQDDHRRARMLAEGLANGGFTIDLDSVQSNIVMFDVPEQSALEFVSAMHSEGVALIPFGPRTVRATLHWQISDDDIGVAISAMTNTLASQ